MGQFHNREGYRTMARLIKYLLYLVAAGVVFVLLIQLIPVPQTNPPVVTQVRWDSPQTKDVFARACADCHSNETKWPWWTRIAPGSWLVYRDVKEGREEFNISDLTRLNTQRLDRFNREIDETVEEGEMPPWYYVIAHPEAALSDQEKQIITDGLSKTLSATLSSK